MKALLYKFVQIALLRATPQDLPGQGVVLWLSVAMAAITGFAGLLISYTVFDSLLRTVISLAVPAAFLKVVLAAQNLRPRFNQAYSALCGTSAVVYIIALPVLPAFFEAVAANGQGKLLIYFILLLDLWAVLIMAHIFKHTLSVGLASGVSMAIALVIMTLLLVETVSPARDAELTPQAFVPVEVFMRHG